MLEFWFGCLWVVFLSAGFLIGLLWYGGCLLVGLDGTVIAAAFWLA